MSDKWYSRRLRVAALLAGVCVALAGCNEGNSAVGTPVAAALPSGATTSSAGDSASADELPVITGTPAQTTVSVGESFKDQPKAGSPNGSSLAFLLMNGPAWLEVDTATGAVSGTPSTIDVGTYSDIHVAVTDGVATVSGPAFTLTVVSIAGGSATPSVTGVVTISGAPITAAVEGVAWSFRPTTTIKGADSKVGFRVANAPKWTTFDSTTGTLSGTPPAGSVGSYPNIVISISEGSSEAALPAFTLSVSAPAPPTISGSPPLTAQAGAPYSFRPTATDPTGTPLVYTIAGKPAWATFDPTTGKLSGTPASSDVGTLSVVSISASDGFASAKLPQFKLSVVTAVSGAATVSWVAPTTRTDGTPLTNLACFRIYYGATSGSYPNSVSVTNPNLTSYAIDALPAGTYYFVATAFDASGNESAYSAPASKTIQ